MMQKKIMSMSGCGVANIFMANEPLAGKRYVKVTERKTKTDWAAFIKEIADKHYPLAQKIRLVMDNLATHKPAALYEAFPPEVAKDPLLNKLYNIWFYGIV